MASKEQVKLLLKRIKTSDDGKDFIEYLQSLANDNYLAWKNCSQDMNDIHKGYAICVDSLITSFAECGLEKTKDRTGIIDFT